MWVVWWRCVSCSFSRSRLASRSTAYIPFSTTVMGHFSLSHVCAYLLPGLTANVHTLTGHSARPRLNTRQDRRPASAALVVCLVTAASEKERMRNEKQHTGARSCRTFWRAGWRRRLRWLWASSLPPPKRRGATGDGKRGRSWWHRSC